MDSDTPNRSDIPTALLADIDEFGKPVDAKPPNKTPGFSRLSLFLSWAAILAMTFFMFGMVLYMQLVPDETATETAGKSIELLQVNTFAKMVVGQKEMGMKGASYSQQLEQFNAGPLDQRYAYTVLVNEVDGPESALDALATVDEAVKEHDYQPTDREKRLRKIIDELLQQYKTGDLDSSDMPEDEQQFLESNLGWVGKLFLYPEGTVNKPDRKALTGVAQTSMILFSVLCVGVFMMLMAGFLFIAVFLFLIAGNKLTGLFQPFTNHGVVYAETFAIWIACFFPAQMSAGLFVERIPAAIVDFIVPIIFFGSLGVLVWPLIRGVSISKLRRDIGWELKNPFVEMGCGVATYLSSLPALGLAIIVSVFVMGAMSLTQTHDEFSSVGGGAHPIVDQFAQGDFNTILMAFLTACIAAPIVEETMFRGVLYRHLRELSANKAKWVSVGLSALFNSLIFASIHPQGLAGIPVLTTIAIAMSMAREWRSSLIAPMTMHAIHNTLATSVLMLMTLE